MCVVQRLYGSRLKTYGNTSREMDETFYEELNQRQGHHFTAAKAAQRNRIPDKLLGNIQECHVFKNETRVLEFNQVIMQKEF